MRLSTPARSSASVTMSADTWYAACLRGRGPGSGVAFAPCSVIAIAYVASPRMVRSYSTVGGTSARWTGTSPSSSRVAARGSSWASLTSAPRSHGYSRLDDPTTCARGGCFDSVTIRRRIGGGEVAEGAEIRAAGSAAASTAGSAGTSTTDSAGASTAASGAGSTGVSTAGSTPPSTGGSTAGSTAASFAASTATSFAGSMAGSTAASTAGSAAR